jgi:hypothetical protein
MEMKKLDKQSAAVFTKLLKEKSYAHFEARSMLLGEKGTRTRGFNKNKILMK